MKTLANMGGRLSTIGPGIPTTLYGRVLSGCYRIPFVFGEVTGVYTNTTFVDAYRGAGRPEATYVVERAMDLFAREIGMDPAAIRRKNFIAPDAFPYDNPSGLLTASNGHQARRRLRELRARPRQGPDNGRLLRPRRGNGRGRQGAASSSASALSSYIEICGVAPSKWIGAVGEGWGAAMWESANIKVHLTGKVVVTDRHADPTARATKRRIARSWPRNSASRCRTSWSSIRIPRGRRSDTAPTGAGRRQRRRHGGHQGRRRRFGRRPGAWPRTCSRQVADDIEIEGGEYRVKGSPEKKKTIQEIAFALDLAFDVPRAWSRILDETAYWDTPNCTFPFGTHIAVVEVDEETGVVDLVRYVAVDDVGKKINPLIVDGQLHGGIVQGVGQALWERAVYSPEGQLLSGSMTDYALPRASWLPLLELDETVTPSPVNPLGVKGVGEAGAIASTAAVANAVNDALSSLGIRHLDMPFTPPTVWRAIQAAKEANA